ncbi:uncharacterized protein K02A2.6 isoform X2 [Anopheles stephensi]|uniref:uncharacterized protein K02A2.6 isoform X2 n=1 Tax=Anopheles stephensi TaxID=30069 RepID=UPI001658AF4A|nr:uncharacterized protein K02A2.6 isoform X2 [Anopheles stephensi]
MNPMDMLRMPGILPYPFNYEEHSENTGVEWKKWLRSFEFTIKACRIVDEDWKKDLLLHFVGPNVQQIFETLPELPNTEMRGPLANVEQYTPNMSAYEEAVARLDKFFLPKQNPTYERHLFRQVKQKSGESFDSFIMRLRVQAERCNFGEKLEEHVKDQVIENCQSAALRREFLRQGDASLDKIVSVAKIFETVAHQEKSFAGSKEHVDLVHSIEEPQHGKKRKIPEPKQQECHRCGYSGHLARENKCPAKGKICNKCGGRDHFAKKCRTKQSENYPRKFPRKQDRYYNTTNKRDQENNAVNHVANEKAEYVFHLTSSDNNTVVDCIIGGVGITAVIDSGSKYNLISKKTWEEMKLLHIKVTNQRRETALNLKAYGGQPLSIIGMFTATISLGTAKTVADFYVVEGDGKTLIGRDTAIYMGILKISIPVNAVEGEKGKLGTINNIVLDLPIKPDAVPVAQPYRRIPVALEKLVDKKLDELLEQGVIEQVNEPSKWISPVVVVPKGDDDVRICVDMRRANEAVERENHPLPTFEDFLPELVKANVFSRLDVKNAFHQKLMEQILTGCEGCLNFIDDIIVYGPDQEQHDERLKKVLQRLKEWNVLLNAEKCTYGVQQTKFLGHVLSANGITPDNDKVESIRNFREPKSGEEVRSFLGLVNYLGRFIPDLATITFPLRQLTSHNQVFIWKSEQQEAFNKLKSIMMCPSTLGYFDVSDRTQLIADASPVGLGAVLVQIDAQSVPRIIAYASKSLSIVERRYAQIEKEALALVWAVERFHFYLYGRNFELITDHKPLEIIFGPKSKPCARIERWVVRLQSYKASVIYRSGKTNIADPLSRLAITEVVDGKTFDECGEEYVSWIVSNASPVALSLKEIEQASEADEIIQAVRQGLEKDVWSEDTSSFKTFSTELCFADKILLRGTRIVIPNLLRERTLHLAHEGHPGMTIMKQRLRAKVWWPKLDQQVENYVKKCKGCMMVSIPSAPEPMIRRELPSAPWQHVAIDFLGPLPSGHSLLVVVDYFSRYIEVEIMKKIDSTETIKRLNPILARFGLPLSITADNGPQFSSDEFKVYCSTNNINLISTTPYWPQQNGEVERQNRSLLKRLMISQSMNTDWEEELNKYLLMYRSSPHSTTKRTPSEMLLSYNIRDRLPSIYEPKIADEEISDRDKISKEKGKLYADKRRNAKCNPIAEGDEVLMKKTFKANKLSTNFGSKIFKVVKRKGGDVVVECKETGVQYRRHVSHLLKIAVDESAPASSLNERNKSVGINDTSVPATTSNKQHLVNSQASLEQELQRSKRTITKPTHLKDYVSTVEVGL